jgi:vitamin B12 transporter
MKKEQILFLLLFFLTALLYAQTEADTIIYIPVVEFDGSKSDQIPGMVIFKIDSTVRLTHQFSSVAEIISQHTPINVRSYGNGLLATINARGLGANHTSVSWNGIPLNSANLGLTDLSLLPSFLFDEIAVVSGGTGPVYGNNSMGVGIELLNTKAKNTTLNISGMNGSYGSVAKNINFNYGGNKFQSSAGIYIYNSDNDFTYKNIAKPGNPLQKQKNARQRQIGLAQIIHFNIKNNNFKTGLWYQTTERELPALMISDKSEELQRDSSIRVFAEWSKIMKKIILSNRISYINEFIFYDNFKNKLSGKSDVKNYRDEVEIKYFPFRKLTLNSSLSGDISMAKIQEYKELKEFSRMEININSKYQIKNNLFIGGGLKKEFTRLSKSPLAFSVGLDSDINERKLLFAANFSRIYTLPTLNDLYWKPGGNEDLKPETGINAQLNLTFNFIRDGFLSFTGYYNLIDDWIQWLPNSSGLFSPVNIKQVESSGLEAAIKQNLTIQNWKFIISGNYSFTKTINKSIINNKELINKQLLYVPLHSTNSYILISYKNVAIYSKLEFTGERFTTADNTYSLEPYFLMDSGTIISYKHDIYQFTIKPEIRNIFDVSYQPIPWRAMPGRSYFLTINLNLNFKQN